MMNEMNNKWYLKSLIKPHNLHEQFILMHYYAKLKTNPHEHILTASSSASAAAVAAIITVITTAELDYVKIVRDTLC